MIAADALRDRRLSPPVPAQGRCGWLIGSLRDVPDTDEWPTTGERVRLAQLRVAKRRADWRLGRWVAKRAVGAALGCDAARIAVIATESGAPLALRDGVPAPVALSLSHAAGRGLCAVAPPEVAVDCEGRRFDARWWMADGLVAVIAS